MRNFYKNVVLLIILTIIVTGTLTVSASNQSLSFKTAQDIMYQHNRTLQKMNIIKNQAQLQILDAKIASNSAKSTLNLFKKYGMTLGRYDELQFVLMRDFFPEQAQYGYETTKANNQITKNSLTIALRDIYLGLYNAYRDMGIKEENLNIAKEDFTHKELKYELGLISTIDFQDAEYRLLKADKELEQSNRDFINMTRTINSFIGQDLDFSYDMIISEHIKLKLYQPVDYYIELALENRHDLTDIQKQLALKELEMSHYESKSYLLDSKVRRDYDNIVRDYEILQIKFEIAKTNIEAEINKAYLDAIKAEKQVVSLLRMIDLQNKRLDQLKQQYQENMVSELVVSEMENGINELINQKDIAVFNYNTMRMKLDNASGIGPSYEGGGR